LAVAAAPVAFLPKVELARCYDLAWRFGQVEGAISEALMTLRAETPKLTAPRSSTAPRLAGIDVPVPTRTRFEPAKYPEYAAVKSITGLVVVEARIDQQGRVSNAIIAKSIEHLDAAALDAARKWRFAPSLVSGQPVEVLAYLPVQFRAGTEMWASDYLELSRFYYERGLWQHVAAALEAARQAAVRDADRFGRTPVVVAGAAGVPANYSWAKVRKEVKPRYTPAGMKAKVQGTVELQVLLDRSGVVGRTSVVKPLEHLTLVAELAALQWRFSPATLDGEPAPTIVFLALDFRLH
jgi:TonB family protein